MERMKRKSYIAFIRYTYTLRRKVKIFNEEFKYNGDYKFYKNLIENKKETIINFVDVFIYDKNQR